MPMPMRKKPTLDLLGLNVAFEEILQVEAWTKVEGKKRYRSYFQEHKTQVKDAIKEIKKDFDLCSFNKYS
jgi:hypothetical protein